MLAKTFRQMLVILERKVRDQRGLWAALWQGFRVPPFAAEDIIRQARRYKSKRELTRGIRLIAKADLALRSNPASKRLVLEKLVLDLTAEPKPELGWSQEELSVFSGLSLQPPRAERGLKWRSLWECALRLYEQEPGARVLHRASDGG